MKTYLLILASLILGLAASQAYAAEYEPAANEPVFPGMKNPLLTPADEFEVPDYMVKKSLKSNNYDKMQEVDFQIFDSLQNGYSYYSFRQQPFMYEPNRNLLMTLKRGTQARSENTNDILDNLFLRVSEDWGANWGDPIQVYDTDQQGIGWARYPSLFPFVDQDNTYYVIYTSPMTAENPDPDWGWLGFMNGIYIEGSSEYNLLAENFYKETENGNIELRWGTDAGLVAGFGADEQPYGLAAGNVHPPTGTPRDENGNIAYRKSNETFSEWVPVIPDAWDSHNFYINWEQDDARYSSLTGLEFSEGHNMVMGAMGLFGETTEDNFPVFCISESGDYGESWSEMDIMPKEIIRQFAEDNGAVMPDSVFLTWGGGSGQGFTYSIARDMVVMPNGDVSFICILQDYFVTTEVPDEQRFRKVVEIYRESGAWGIREIASMPTTTFLLYINADNEGHNQMVFEFQISRSVDGEYLIAKWLQTFFWEVEGIDDPVSSSDIMFAVRRAGEDKWSSPEQLTETFEIDRLTWIPNLVPNDLNNIPLLKVMTKPDPDINEGDLIAQRANQLMIEVPQHVMMGHFDGSIALSVEDTKHQDASADISAISPNPASGEALVTFNIPQSGDISLDIYDLMGQKIMTVHKGAMSAGMHSLRFNTAEMAAGSYYCVLSHRGERTTKMMTVVR